MLFMPRARIVLTLALAAVAVVPAAPSAAATDPKPSDLVVPRVGGAPGVLHPGQQVMLQGRVRLRAGHRPTTATITVSMRSLRGADGARLVGTMTTGRLLVRKSRSFKALYTVPTRAFGGIRTPTRYTLVVCARTTPTRRAACRSVRRVIVRPAPAPAGAPQSAQAPAPAEPAPPAADPAPEPTPTPTPGLPVDVPQDEGPREPVFVPGARSLGDRLFPTLGNGGYDAQRYDLELDYQPVVHELDATTTMTAVATHDLSEFSLDFQGFAITALTVDGKPATFKREANELVITPPAGITKGTTFVVKTSYNGQPPEVIDPDGSSEGWLMTHDGAIVLNEPMGAQGWFPNNNHPTDKATYQMAVTVPAGMTSLANGVLVSQEQGLTTTTWTWRQDEPMASYLTTATLGVFDFTEDELADGTKLYTAIDPVVAAVETAEGAVARVPDIIPFFESKFGPYPFTAAGSIVDFAPTVGYALETQTKPNYALPASVSTVAHENAHQWWGNSVTLGTWSDIWLNEGFAEWSSWLWDEHEDPANTTKGRADALYDGNAAGTAFWEIPPAAPPTGADIFDNDAMYDRGAMTLEFLRQIVGDAKFYDLLRTWARVGKYGNATTSDFTALAEQVTGFELTAYFQDWLYEADKPTTKTASPA